MRMQGEKGTVIGEKSMKNEEYKKNETYLVRYPHAQKSQKNTIFVFYFNQQA